MLLGEDVRTGYQLLVDLTVVTYFIPFLYLFATAARHGLRLSAAAGMVVTVVAIAFSLVPPDGVASVWRFEAKLASVCLLFVGAARMAFLRGRRERV
jgi:K+-sensing histidine kinase KdpD